VPGVSVGDLVTLIGTEGGETITAEEVARKADTIAYEITCAVGKRVRRVYRGGGEVLLQAGAGEAREGSIHPLFARDAERPTGVRFDAGRDGPPASRFELG
jgi:hypothetical protein